MTDREKDASSLCVGWNSSRLCLFRLHCIIESLRLNTFLSAEKLLPAFLILYNAGIQKTDVVLRLVHPSSVGDSDVGLSGDQSNSCTCLMPCPLRRALSGSTFSHSYTGIFVLFKIALRRCQTPGIWLLLHSKSHLFEQLVSGGGIDPAQSHSLTHSYPAPVPHRSQRLGRIKSRRG